MKHDRNPLLAAVAVLLATGCSHVTSAAPANRSVTDELWYVRSTSFLGMTVSSTILYCGPTDNGATVCRKARIEDGPAPNGAPSAATPAAVTPAAPSTRCRASALPQWKDADAAYKKKLLDYCRAPAGSNDPGVPSP